MSRFNPRTREGATHLLLQLPIHNSGFNPRTREGATNCLAIQMEASTVSIHAPVRVRL